MSIRYYSLRENASHGSFVVKVDLGLPLEKRLEEVTLGSQTFEFVDEANNVAYYNSFREPTCISHNGDLIRIDESRDANCLLSVDRNGLLSLCGTYGSKRDMVIEEITEYQVKSMKSDAERWQSRRLEA